MRNLLIDIGNSTVKIAFTEPPSLLLSSLDRFDKSDLHSRLAQICSNERFNVILLCSSARRDPTLDSILEPACKRVIILNGDTLLPIENLYSTPETLGADRLAAAVGANYLYPDEDLIIFDFGTALTVDFVTKKGEFRGGNISPGVSARFNSLRTATANLPLVSINNTTPIKDFGQSTEEAIISGVALGLIFEVEGYLRRYSDHKIIFTGGDVIFFAERTKYPIFVVYNLVLIGLSHIANQYATY